MPGEEDKSLSHKDGRPDESCQDPYPRLCQDRRAKEKIELTALALSLFHITAIPEQWFVFAFRNGLGDASCGRHFEISEVGRGWIDAVCSSRREESGEDKKGTG